MDFDRDAWRVVARTYAGLGAAFAVLSLVCVFGGGPLSLAAAVVAGVSAALALMAAAGFRRLAPGAGRAVADLAQFGWGFLNLLWTGLSLLMPVAVVVWLFVLDERPHGEGLRVTVALPVFLVFSALVRHAHRLAAAAFDRSTH
ncbi:hypothetical protein [Streptomyces sp. DH12]|uniref:hypothetical protein n=1 Tax=Streptomyces sp. DH12 TaxID=2857010 RepID=UPI001E30CFD8|nr:hypothetical protein [Streptomyces sp. DH12]